MALWLNRVQPEGRFRRVEGVVQTLDDLTARDYVESDPLDLDYLSSDSDRGAGEKRRAPTLPGSGSSLFAVPVCSTRAF